MIQKTVKTGIFSLVWIDVGLVAAVRGPQVAAGRRHPLASRLLAGPLALLDLNRNEKPHATWL